MPNTVLNALHLLIHLIRMRNLKGAEILTDETWGLCLSLGEQSIQGMLGQSWP